MTMTAIQSGCVGMALFDLWDACIKKSLKAKRKCHGDPLVAAAGEAFERYVQAQEIAFASQIIEPAFELDDGFDRARLFQGDFCRRRPLCPEDFLANPQSQFIAAGDQDPVFFPVIPAAGRIKPDLVENWLICPDFQEDHSGIHVYALSRLFNHQGTGGRRRG